MTHITVTRSDKTHRVPCATVGDLLDLMQELLSMEREKLLLDLEASGATSEEKSKALAELRTEYGLTAKVMQSAFSLEGAVAIIKHLTDPEDWESILKAPADDLVYLALRTLGYEASDEDPDKESQSAEGNEGQTGAMS